ncbi:MAG: hypothetical protein R3F21_09510 [Myxococcota bacterium]
MRRLRISNSGGAGLNGGLLFESEGVYHEVVLANDHPANVMGGAPLGENPCIAGAGNCAARTSATTIHQGTFAFLGTNDWTDSPQYPAPWNALTATCFNARPIWCVEDPRSGESSVRLLEPVPSSSTSTQQA